MSPYGPDSTPISHAATAPIDKSKLSGCDAAAAGRPSAAGALKVDQRAGLGDIEQAAAVLADGHSAGDLNRIAGERQRLRVERLREQHGLAMKEDGAGRGLP